MYNLDIMFLSILFPQGDDFYESKVTKNRSQNITAIQSMLMESMEKQNSGAFSFINTLLVCLYGKGYTEVLVENRKTSIITESGKILSGMNHAFINLPFFYSTSLFWGAKHLLKEWIRSDLAMPKTAVAYSLTSYSLKAMRLLKKKDPKITTAIIVPDLPQYTYRKSNKILTNMKAFIGRKIVETNIKRNLKYVDLCVLFSEKMTEELQCGDRYVVVEGIASDLFSKVIPKRLDNSRGGVDVLYAGGLERKYGLEILLESLRYLPENFRLLIAGRGEMKTEIEQYAENDKRIQYLGEIPRNELLSLEKGADILVNPRINCDIFTRYSFPSKNMEYLSSGVPAVVFKLEGIPDEYDDFFNYPKNETAQALAEKLMEVGLTGRANAIERAQKAQSFVLTEKNKDVQVGKILRKISEMV